MIPFLLSIIFTYIDKYISAPLLSSLNVAHIICFHSFSLALTNQLGGSPLGRLILLSVVYIAYKSKDGDTWNFPHPPWHIQLVPLFRFLFKLPYCWNLMGSLSFLVYKKQTSLDLVIFPFSFLWYSWTFCIGVVLWLCVYYNWAPTVSCFLHFNKLSLSVTVSFCVQSVFGE